MKKLFVLSIVFMFLFVSLAYDLDAGISTSGSDTETVKTPKKKDADDPIVYVKEKGKKYHKKNCKVAGAGKTGIKLSEALKRGYEPCSVCKPPEKPKTKKKTTKKK